ncbi:zinc finger, CCHC-type containing protein [Tanacetum coccineum]
MLRTNRGGEFTSNEFTQYCKENGIARQLTAPYSPQQNGVVERRNRTIMSTTRCMMKATNMPQNFWAEAVRHAIYILNSVPTKALEDITPYEAIKQRKPNLENLRIFGCIAYVKVPSQHLTKLDDRSIKMVYLGNEQGSKAYRLFDPTTQRVCVSRDVKFKENETWDWKDYIGEHTNDEPEWTDFNLGDPEVTNEHPDQETQPNEDDNEFPDNNDDDESLLMEHHSYQLTIGDGVVIRDWMRSWGMGDSDGNGGGGGVEWVREMRMVGSVGLGGVGEREGVICPLYDVLFHKSASNGIQLENPLQRSKRVRIVGSCNGLMCFLEELKNTLFIYNPTTKRSNLLSCSHRIGLSEVRYHGFGYDELSHDYKVVITRSELPTIIYSLKTGKWKEIGHFPCGSVLNDAKFTNGTLHWATGDESSSHSWKIVSLDLASETYGEVLQPEYHKGDDYLELGVAGEWLCVLHHYCESPVVDVWVMKVCGVKDSWTKLASIPYPDHWWGLIWDPLCISKDGKLLLQFGLQLHIYDSKDSSSSVIEIKCYDACIVVESLVSPFPPLGLADNNGDED